MCNALDLESAKHIMLMAVAVNVMINVHRIKIQCAVRAVRHTTINAGRGSATAKDLRTTPVSTIREAVKVSKTVNCRSSAVIGPPRYKPSSSLY